MLGSALGTGATLALFSGFKTHAEPARSGERQMFASWVHGTAAHVQHSDFNLRGGDDSVLAVDMAGGILRFGWGAEMYFRARSDDLETRVKEFRSGAFWVHYPIPTPVIEGGRRSVARDLLVRWGSPNNMKITIDQVNVWDGDDRFFIRDGVWGDPEEPMHRMSLADHSVNFGIGVSLRVKGNNVNFQQRLKILAIGVDFFA
jgi:hypothetical protein